MLKGRALNIKPALSKEEINELKNKEKQTGINMLDNNYNVKKGKDSRNLYLAREGSFILLCY
jgi:hypothetical protein